MASEALPQPATMTEPLGPTRAGERMDAVDILRGFALFGILLVNMQFFATPLYAMFLEQRMWTGMADRVAEVAIMFLAQGKFYTLFSFLFGLGFSIILMRAAARGRKAGRVYARRLLVLLFIGLVHAFLIWMGDILVMYSVLGFVLLLLRNVQPKWLLRWAVVLLLIPPALNFGLAGLIEMGRAAGAGAEIDRSFAEQAENFRRLHEDSMRAYAQGSFAEVTQQRVVDVTTMWTFAIFFAPNVLAMFVLGLYAGKRGIFQDVPGNLPFIRRVQRWGLLLGLPANAGLTYAMTYANPAEPTLLSSFGVLCGAVGQPALALFYASSLVLLAQRVEWKRRLAPVAKMGRMALTNYLMQSLVATTIFYSYGLGFYGQVGPAAGVLLVLAIYAAQMPLSGWWLARFQFGPAEWAWRSLTYGQAQPMRRNGSALSARA